jgi:hypothetical protein
MCEDDASQVEKQTERTTESYRRCLVGAHYRCAFWLSGGISGQALEKKEPPMTTNAANPALDGACCSRPNDHEF